MRKRSAVIAAALLLVFHAEAQGRPAENALTAVKVTALGETGSTDLDAKADQIVLDTANTKSYGFLGLNTAGDLPEFIERYGASLGLSGRPGSVEFDASWREAALRSTALRDAQIEFHDYLISRGIQFLVDSGAPSLAGDPVVQAYVADIRVQYGWGLTQGHLENGLRASLQDRDLFLDAVDESMRARLGANFRTYLSQYPDRRQALLNRIDRRRHFSEKVVAEIQTGKTVTRRSIVSFEGPIAHPVRYVSLKDQDPLIRQMFGDPRGAEAPVTADELWPSAFGQ